MRLATRLRNSRVESAHSKKRFTYSVTELFTYSFSQVAVWI